MSLRDELGQRLVSVFILGNGGTSSGLVRSPADGTLRFSQPSDPDQFPKAEFMDFGPVADECIRQMEWAYKQGGRGEFWVGDGREGRRRLVDASEMPVTMAPEDWKP